MRRVTWSKVVDALVFVRVGQELGTTSELAQAFAGAIDAAIAVIGRLCC